MLGSWHLEPDRAKHRAHPFIISAFHLLPHSVRPSVLPTSRKDLHCQPSHPMTCDPSPLTYCAAALPASLLFLSRIYSLPPGPLHLLCPRLMGFSAEYLRDQSLASVWSLFKCYSLETPSMTILSKIACPIYPSFTLISQHLANINLSVYRCVWCFSVHHWNISFLCPHCSPSTENSS